MKVLVVDDEPVVRLFLKKMLVKKFKFEVLEAKDGVEALTMLQSDAPDVMFLDVAMPVMDGVEVLEAVREDPSHNNLPVIMLTAINQREVVNKCIQLGITDFILKPVDYESTYERLNTLLRDDEQLFRKFQRSREELAAAAIEEDGGVQRPLVIVDRDTAFRKLCSEMLGDTFTIFEGTTGADCLKLFLEHKPRFVLMGEKLEIINEQLLSRKLKAFESDYFTEIFLCTDYPGRYSKSQTIFDGILQKTMIPEKLQREFSRVVLRKPLPAATLEKLFGKSMQEELYQATRQAFGLLAGETLIPEEIQRLNELHAETAVHATLSAERPKQELTLHLLGSREDFSATAKKIIAAGGEEHKEEEQVFMDIAETIAGRLKISLNKKGAALSRLEATTSPNKVHPSSFPWQYAFLFRTSSNTLFFAGITME